MDQSFYYINQNEGVVSFLVDIDDLDSITNVLAELGTDIIERKIIFFDSDGNPAIYNLVVEDTEDFRVCSVRIDTLLQRFPDRLKD